MEITILGKRCCLRDSKTPLLQALSLVASIFLFSGECQSSDEIIRPYRSMRSQGLGGTFVTDGDYADALFGNPARHTEVSEGKVTAPELNMESNFNLLNNIDNITNIKGTGAAVVSSIAPLTGKNLHGRFGMLIAGYTPEFIDDKTGFAFGLLFNVQANILPHFNTYVDSQTFVDFGPHMGFSRKFLDERLSIGMNLHANYRVAGNFRISALDFLNQSGKSLNLKSLGSEGFGIDSDLGAFYKLPWEISFARLSVGASFNNIVGSTYQLYKPGFVVKDSGTPPPRNPRTLNLGVRSDWPDLWIFKDCFTSIEMTDIGSLPYQTSVGKRFHMGGEGKPFHWLITRLGVNQGYLTAGLGFNLPVLKIDLATWGEEIGSTAGMQEDRRLGIRLAAEF